MSAVPQVFISATSRDLRSFREAVSDVLLTLGAHPVTEEHFAPDYRSVVEMLRAKIGRCDAAICLVGRRYGSEPLKRDADQPRRSYSQLEYEMAVELGKPVFVFVATDDCALDAAPDEPEELRGLQLEHMKRIIASDLLRMAFHSLGHLTDQVRVMRFDAESLAQGITTRLAVLMTADLVGVETLRERRGEVEWVRDVLEPYHDLLNRTLIRWKGSLQSDSPTDCQVNFETADAAVNAALELHQTLRLHDWGSAAPGLRVGIDVGQVVRYGNADDSHTLQAGQALNVSRRLSELGRAGQTLLTRAAFDIAREHVRQIPISGDGTISELRWRDHGRYMLAGFDEPLDVCEVGLEGQAPLSPPEESERVQRADSLEERRMRGWRPAAGQEIPRRPGWFVDKKLGEGGFGEVWVARHDRTKELRVFKFCFDATRLTSFKRELTLFKLLRESLGKREDIAGLLEVELDQPPFYLESEYVAGGNLHDWAVVGGRLAAMSLEERLRFVAEIARAASAAHSVGIIHKDLKPSNVFMRQDTDGRWHPILADFGIGAVADRSQLERLGITVTGFTHAMLEPGSSRTGTRMYQPPEANLARPATVQGDVYALGVMLYQMVIGDFDQPLGIGWERRLEAARTRGWEGEAPAESHRQSSPPPSPTGAKLLRALDPSGELVIRFLREDIGACVDVDPAARLATAAQLVERLQSVDQRVAAEMARREAEEARKQADEIRLRAQRAAIQMRRLLAALAASIVALIVVCGLGVFALTEWRLSNTLKDEADRARKEADENAKQATKNEERAVKNEKRAEESAMKAQASAKAASHQSQLALDTLNAVIFDIQGSVENLSGSSPIRRRLLGTALGRLEKLSGEFVRRSTADRQTAAAFQSMGDLVLKFGEAPQSKRASGEAGPGGGDLHSAVESARRFYSRSMEIFQEHAKADPENSGVRRDLSISYNKLGDVHLKLGATDMALQSYEKGLELREALAKADPNDAQAKRDLSVSYDRLGNVYLKLGATDKALQSYQDALALREALANADPGDVQAKRNLSVSYSKVGNVHLRMGATDKALQSHQKDLALSEALAKADPNDAQARRDLSVSYNKLGDVHLKLGAIETALQSYEKGLELREALAKADPNDAQAKRDLSVSYNNLGDVHLKLGATDKALASYQNALDLREALSKADPSNAEAQQDLSASFYRIAQAHERANDLDRARGCYEKMLGVDQELSRRFPENAATLRKFAGDCEILGRFSARCQNWTAAAKYARQAIEYARAAQKSAGASQAFHWDFSITLGILGDAQSKVGQFREARQSYEEAAQAGPKSPAVHGALAWLLATCWDDSVRDGKRAVLVATNLCEVTEWKDPDALDTLAAAYAEVGNFDQAVKWAKKATDQPNGLDPAVLEHAKARLKLYEAHKPYHDPKPEPAREPKVGSPSR